MKKIILIFIAVMCSIVAWSDDDERGGKVKLTDAEAYALKKPITRASGEGQSSRPNLARQYAADDARSALSQALESALLRASKNTDSDLSQYLGSDDDAENLYETESRKNNLAKEICQNVLKGTPIVKMDKFYNKKNKRYTVIVCVEYIGDPSDMAKETVKNLKNRLSDDDKKKFESDLDKVEMELEKELLNNASKDEDDEDFEL